MRARTALVTVAALIAMAGLACAPVTPPGERDHLLDKGDQALSAGRLADAEQAFVQVIASDPGNARAVLGLGLAKLRQGRLADALVQFDVAVKSDPNSPDPAYLRAHTLSRLGRRAEAIDGYKTLIDAHPELPRPALEMIDLMIAAGRLDDARREATAAVKRHPRDFDLLVIDGRVLGLTGAHAESIEPYTQAREIRSYDPRPVYGLIEAYRKTGRLKESADLIPVFDRLQASAKDLDGLRQQAEKSPDDPQTQLRYIDRLFAENRIDEAVGRTADFLSQHPAEPGGSELALKAAEAAAKAGNAEGARTLIHAVEMSAHDRDRSEYLALARIHESLGEYEDALQLYDRYLQEVPDDPAALVGLGKAAMHAGKLDLAEAPLKRAMALAPKDAGAHAGLGLLMIKKGDETGAAAQLHEALQRDPAQADALFGLGFLAHQKRHNDEAEKYLRQALQSRPGDGSAQVVLALVLSEKGRCEEAIPIFTSALSADYKNLTLHMGLVRCLEQTGRTSEAAAQRKIAEQILGRPTQ